MTRLIFHFKYNKIKFTDGKKSSCSTKSRNNNIHLNSQLSSHRSITRNLCLCLMSVSSDDENSITHKPKILGKPTTVLSTGRAPWKPSNSGPSYNSPTPSRRHDEHSAMPSISKHSNREARYKTAPYPQATLGRFSDLKRSKPSVQKIISHLHELEDFVLDDGLEKRLLDKFWRDVVLLSKQHLIVRGIHLAIPRDEVLSDTINFLVAWVVDSAHSNSPKELVIKGILQWLTCAVHCKVIPGRDLQHTYYLLLAMLYVPGYSNELFHLLYYLTEPHLVTKYTVKRVLNIRFPRKNFCHLALLSLYKRLKPHLLPDEKISAFANDLELFPVFPRKILDCFNVAIDNRNLTIITKRNRYPNWRLQTIAYKRHKLGSIVYVSEMTLTEAILEAKQSEIFIGGTVFDSFLLNPFGSIFLALANRYIHENFERFVEEELKSNLSSLCFKQNEEFSMFLSNLNKLMCIYGQTIVPVDIFLKNNLVKWNGVLYTKQIFRLIPHLMVSDSDEFFHSILAPLYSLNVKFKDRQFSKYTIRSLAECLMNNIDKLQEKEQILYTKHNLRPSESALQHFEKCFRHLCTFFVNAFEKDADILHEITDNYVLMTETIEQDEYRHILLPIDIMHRILINSDFMLVEKVSRILLMQAHHEAAQLQIEDFVNILFKNILRSRIFNKIEPFQQIDNHIAKYKNIRKCFRSRNSISFMPLVQINENGEYLTNFDQNLYINLIRQYCEYFSKLVNKISE